MPERIVPMIHVPNVGATADWYASIGFEICNVNRECDGGEIDWALLRLGQSDVMLNAGGLPSSARRRDPRCPAGFGARWRMWALVSTSVQQSLSSPAEPGSG